MRKRSSSSVRIFYPKFEKAELIQKIQERLRDLAQKLPLSFVVLFGSYAHGNYTVASDIDLLIIYKGKRRKDAFKVVKKTIEIPQIEPHIYSESEYQETKQAIHRMMESGIKLWPPEQNKGPH